EEPHRKAQFKTVIALITKDDQREFTGICPGKILNKRQGNGGFGYDPIFCPEGLDQSFAQVEPKQKNKIRHRGKAIKQLVIYLEYNSLNSHYGLICALSIKIISSYCICIHRIAAYELTFTLPFCFSDTALLWTNQSSTRLF